MPRIAVAVGVLVLIVFSIGFNTVRYSTVWEMVGDPVQPDQPDQPSPSAAIREPADISKSATTSQSTASWDGAAAGPSPGGWTGEYSCPDSSAGEAWTDNLAADAQKMGNAHEAPSDYATQKVAEVEPSGEYAARLDPAEASVPSASVIRVVDLSGAGARGSLAGHGDSSGQVCRLPPIDQVAPCPADHRAPSPEPPFAIYPSSGI